MNSEEFHRTLKPYPASRLIFMGIGNPVRGDDGAGLNPENHLQEVLDKKPRAVVFIDAAHFHAAPGTISWLDQTQLDQLRISTHAFSMVMIEAYLRSQRWMDFHYLAIEPESTELGEGLTQTVRESSERFFVTQTCQVSKT
jgi:Ni,Fe-hydrogenase maturation factor